MKKYLYLIPLFLLMFIPHDVFAKTLITEPYSFSDVYYEIGFSSGYRYNKNETNYDFGGFTTDFSAFSNFQAYYPHLVSSDDQYINFGIQWSNKDWCKGGEITFTGNLVPQATEESRNMFANANLDWYLEIEVPTNSYKALCTTNIEIHQSTGISMMHFTCTVPKMDNQNRSFKFLLNLGDYGAYGLGPAFWGIQKSTFNYSCDISTGDVINNQNQNTQNIIDNQNTNTQKEIDNANQNQAQTNQRLDGINNSLNDDNIDTTSSSSFFGNFQDNNYGLTSVITAPLQFIQSLNNSQCSAIHLTVPFLENNNNFDIPCMSTIYRQHFNGAFTLYQTITTGFIAYWIAIKIFALVKGFKDPDDDRIEVLDL